MKVSGRNIMLKGGHNKQQGNVAMTIEVFPPLNLICGCLWSERKLTYILLITCFDSKQVVVDP